MEVHARVELLRTQDTTQRRGAVVLWHFLFLFLYLHGDELD